jgi:hypothetical protein
MLDRGGAPLQHSGERHAGGRGTRERSARRAFQNTNNTADLGSMQLNSSYIQSLARYGIRPNMCWLRAAIPTTSLHGVSETISGMTRATCGRGLPIIIPARRP